MAAKPITECTSYTQFLCEDEKKIIRKFQRDYEEIYGKRPSMPDAVSDIIREYGELKNKK